MSPLQLAEDELENETTESDRTSLHEANDVTARAKAAERNTPSPLNISRSQHTKESQLTSKSQHTIIEYYTDNEDYDEDENDDGFDDDSSNNDSQARAEAKSRFQMLQRTGSSQGSVGSVHSDAFSLPLGTSSVVSSLECDNVEVQDDETPMEDISLKDLKRSFVRRTSTDNKTPSKISEPSGMREILIHAHANQVSALRLSSSSPVTTPLGKVDEEGPRLEDEQDDDDNDDDGKSIGYEDLAGGSDEPKDSNASDATTKMRNSLFMSLVLNGSLPAMNHLSDSTRSMTEAKILSSREVKAKDDDEYYLEQWTKNLPPELDLVQARKYLIELAEGVSDTPRTPAKEVSPKALVRSNEKSTGLRSFDSEYTELVIDEDSELQHTPKLKDLALLSPIPRGKLQASGKSSTSLVQTPPNGSLSTEYTEVVVEDTPTSQTRRKYYRDTSYDVTEIVEYDETEVEEESYVEEEILEESEAATVEESKEPAVALGQ